VAWVAGKGDGVSDVFHAGDEHDKALKPEAKPGVRAGPVLAQVQVPSRWRGWWRANTVPNTNTKHKDTQMSSSFEAFRLMTSCTKSKYKNFNTHQKDERKAHQQPQILLAGTERGLNACQSKKLPKHKEQCARLCCEQHTKVAAAAAAASRKKKEC
jgi:hypothetical protein